MTIWFMVFYSYTQTEHRVQITLLHAVHLLSTDVVSCVQYGLTQLNLKFSVTSLYQQIDTR